MWVFIFAFHFKLCHARSLHKDYGKFSTACSIKSSNSTMWWNIIEVAFLFHWSFVFTTILMKNDLRVRRARSYVVGLICPLVKIHSRRNRSFLFQTVVSNYCGCTPRGVRGIKRPEILWEIQKYSWPGRPSSQNWVKSKTIKKFFKIP